MTFSDFSTAEDVIRYFDSERINYGNRRNQIKRFFNISEGDIILVPLFKAIALGRATGEKRFASGIKNGENRVGVDVLKTEDGNILKIPRNKLSNGLS